METIKRFVVDSRIGSVGLALFAGLILHYGERILCVWLGPLGEAFGNHYFEPAPTDGVVLVLTFNLLMIVAAAIPVSLVAAAGLRVTLRYQTMFYPLVTSSALLLLGYWSFVVDSAGIVAMMEPERIAVWLCGPIAVMAVFLLVARLLAVKTSPNKPP